MESIVQVVRGHALELNEVQCAFCNKDASFLFGIITGKKFDGKVFRSLGVCKEHKNKINALLSGEFDIDMIYLKQSTFRKGQKKVNLRRMPPPLTIADTANRKTLKTCEFIGCKNKFYGIAVQKYCNDSRCKELRKAAAKTTGRRMIKDPDATNIIIEKKKVGRHIRNNQLLRLTCRARDGEGHRCANTFLITYCKNRKIYPMFCEEHRSAYKRNRFRAQKGKNAKGNRS